MKGNTVVIDNGHAQQCVAWIKDGEIKTSVKPSRIEMGANGFSLAGAKTQTYYDVSSSTKYTVGENVSDPMPLNFKDYAISPMNRVLVNSSIRESGLGGEVSIITGLPFSYFFNNDGEINTKFIGKVKESMAETVLTNDNKPLPFKIANHQVMPESLAAFFDYAITMEEGDLSMKDINRPICIIDMGGGTVDITYIHVNQGSPSIDGKKSGTEQVGVIELKEKLKNKICQQLEIDNLPEAIIDKALKTGFVPYYEEQRDIQGLLTPLKKQMALQIYSIVQKTVGSGAELEGFLCVGGGASLISHELRDLGLKVLDVEEPDLANARGMIKFSLIQ